MGIRGIHLAPLLPNILCSGRPTPRLLYVRPARRREGRAEGLVQTDYTGPALLRAAVAERSFNWRCSMVAVAAEYSFAGTLARIQALETGCNRDWMSSV